MQHAASAAHVEGVTTSFLAQQRCNERIHRARRPLFATRRQRAATGESALRAGKVNVLALVDAKVIEQQKRCFLPVHLVTIITIGALGIYCRRVAVRGVGAGRPACREGLEHSVREPV